MATWPAKLISVAALVFVAAVPAVAQERPYYCTMTPEQAAASKDCLRFYLECTERSGGSGFQSPIFKDLSAADMLNLQLEGAVLWAARNCKIFSYEEGYAAVQLHRMKD